MCAALWNIVLAAGAGQRLASVTGGIPKQFWSDDGGPTLLEDTLARIAALAPPEQTVIVVDRSHRRFVHERPDVALRGRVVYQPADRGTAAGVLYGLSEVVTRDSDATVVLIPSDHGVAEPTLFVDGVVAAVADVDSHREDVVLLGAVPSHPDRDYGWISSYGRSIGSGLRSVSAFVEKPDAVTATRLFNTGAVWNTMVLVARARTLLQLFRRHLPELTRAFEAALMRDDLERRDFLQTRYDGLPRADFSRDLIARAGELFVRTWPADMGWSDLGTPDRLSRWRMSQAALQLAGTR